MILLVLTVVVSSLAGLSIGFGHVTKSGWALAAIILIALGVLFAFTSFLRNDHELLFGCLTIFAALATLSVYAAFLSYSTVENDAAVIFLTLVVLSVAALTLIAHDWARRSFMIAAVIVAAGLSVFIVRAGFETLKVPPQWNRTAIVDRTRATEQFLQGQEQQQEQEQKQEQKQEQEQNPKPSAKASAAASAKASAAAKAKAGKLALDQQICVIAGKAPPKTGQWCGKPDNKINSNTDWVIAKHRLDVYLATYRYAVTGLKADGDALQALIEQQPDVDQDISILDAIENGPDALWRSATHSAGPALVPGPLGWVVLGAIALGLLAWWVKVNASQLAGPVMLPAASGSDTNANANEDLNTVLRVAVLRNLPEPGASPGSTSTNPVTNLLDIVAGPLGVISKILKAVLAVAGRSYGYQINLDVATAGASVASPATASPATAGSTTASSPTAGPTTASPTTASPTTASSAGTTTGTAVTSSSASPATTTALIRVIAVSGGVTLRSRTFSSSDPEEAVRSAGLWAAGFILGRSTRVPSWAAWNAETADSLAEAGERESLTISILEGALKGAPDSGILLVLLGHHYELDGQYLPALNCYARAVAAHPRYPVARYRLAATIASLRYYEGAISLDDLRVLRLAISALKGRIADDRKWSSHLTGLTGDAAPARDVAFATLAGELLKRLAHDMRYHYRLVSAVRRSERNYNWPGLELSFTTAASRFRQLVNSARWAVEAKSDKKIEDSKALGKLGTAADKPDSWWQISYNAACGYAAGITEDIANDQKRERANIALSFLEQTLVHPGIHQLTASWVQLDPDLQSIRASCPRFARFAAQLRSGD
jgi:hypothetical protein